MKLVALAIAVALLLPSLAFAQQPTYETLKADAERAYAEGSYARALTWAPGRFTVTRIERHSWEPATGGRAGV